MEPRVDVPISSIAPPPFIASPPRPVSFVADVGLPRFPRSKSRWPSTLKQIYI